MKYFQKFRVTGVANTVAYDGGLESSSENPKRLLSILIQTDEIEGSDVQGWWEREKIFEIPDDLIDTAEQLPSASPGKSFNRINEIEVGYDLPVGSTFKVALSCGTTPNNIRGAYRYEITS